MNSRFQLYNSNNSNGKKLIVLFKLSSSLIDIYTKLNIHFAKPSLLARLKLTNGIHNNNEKNLSRKSLFSLANNCCNSRQCRAQIYTVHIPNMQIEMYACTLFLRTHAVIKLKIDREFYGILD